MRLVRSFPLRRWSPLRSRSVFHDLRFASTASLSKLDLPSIDSKWQKIWEESRTQRSTPQGISNGKEKAYILPMFPYPSGTLHMGHLRVYTISDVLARFKRMKGYDVLYPMGWDAFGLPAENAAIEHGIDPAEWTIQNITKMKEQLKAMGGDFDWGREFMTCSPSFYKHTQRIFLMLYEQGLAYQAEAVVNYDPIDRTVLANEQVDANGFSWRSGAPVEKIKLKQWFLRITAYKEDLLEDLDKLARDGSWPERVLSMQRHWIGKSKGATIRFPLTQPDKDPESREESIDIFTTRPDTLFGVQYLALSISHPIVERLAHTSGGLQAFVDTASSLPPESKAGYLLPGVEAKHPLCRVEGMPALIQRALPIYVAPYVLSEYGEGAVMGVPGHDERDFGFWREQNPEAEILTVVAPPGSESPTSTRPRAAFVHEGILTELCGPFTGLASSEATEEIVSRLSEKRLGSLCHSWRLRDWLISRQRYWGTPIPMIHCQKCGTVPVPVDQLPVELPKMPKDLSFKGNPLENAHDWISTSCPKCSSPAKRDTDTMDTFVDSSWYYMRFPDSRNSSLPFSPDAAAAFLPVDTYIGGVEHAILHLLYARFIYKFLSKSTLFPPNHSKQALDEPFRTLITQGMVHGKTYSDPKTGRFIHPTDLDLSNPSSPRVVSTGKVPSITFEKMSKSKHNGVDPTQTMQKYGADATRAHILFAGPVSEIIEWDEEKIVGMQRWFNRLLHVVEDVISTFPSGFSASGHLDRTSSSDPLSDLDHVSLTRTHVSLLEATNSTITSVTATLDTNSYALNTVISDLIKMTNLYSSDLTSKNETDSPPQQLSYTLISAHLRLLAPIAPAFAEECWERLHFPSSVGSIHERAFPKLLPIPITTRDKEIMQNVAVQIDGKLRFTMKLPVALPAYGIVEENLRKEWLLEKIRHSADGDKWLRDEEGKTVKQKRVVVVGDGREGVKLVNIVLEKSKNV